jgi:SHS2 domain-containing protein
MEIPLPFVPFEPVEHTADLAFIARGRTREELFTNAALAMLEFLYDRETVEPEEAERIELQGEDLEELLVGWLQEILYRQEVHHRLYHSFQVESAGPEGFRAIAWGERRGLARHEIRGYVKAATYHDLAIGTEMTAGQALLRVRVVLDT